RERRRAEPVLPGAPARPQLADPAAGLGAEEMIDGPRPLESRRLSHPVALEQLRQLLDECALLRSALEADVIVVDARDRDHVDAPLEQRVDDCIGQHVARGLHDDLHAAHTAVARDQAFHERVADRLAQRLEQELTARDDDAPLLLDHRAVRAQVAPVEIGHPLGQMVDDARHVARRFADHARELAARIGPEAILVAVTAAGMAGPRGDVVDRFHRALLYPARMGEDRKPAKPARSELQVSRSEPKASEVQTGMPSEDRTDWSPEVEGIRARRALAQEHGGRDAVAAQHAQGRLAIRERIAALLDAGSFRETGPIAGASELDEAGAPRPFTPANYGVGTGRIDDRPCAVGGEDFTQRGGSPSPAGLRKSVFAEDLCLRLRVPLVRLLQGAGGSVAPQASRSEPKASEAHKGG